MTMVVAAEAPPLTADATGVLRVGQSRVTLDTIIGAFLDGTTAEGITEQYSSVSLGEVYSVIAYYLSHTSTIDAYLREREAHSALVRQANERLFNPSGLRARLLARDQHRNMA